MGENINLHEAFKEEEHMGKKQSLLRKLLAVMIAVFSLTLLTPEVATQLGTMQTVQAAVKISSKSTIMVKGQKKTLKLKGTKKKAKWSSNKKSVATVSSKGVVVAKKKGTAVITAKVGNKKYTCKVTVETPKLNKKSVTLKPGKSTTLKVKGTKQRVKWSSSNTSVAIVTGKGKVIAKSGGTAKVIANIGGANFVCRIIVKGNQVPVVKPTATPTPEPTATPMPEPTATPEPQVSGYEKLRDFIMQNGSDLEDGEKIVFANRNVEGKFCTWRIAYNPKTEEFRFIFMTIGGGATDYLSFSVPYYPTTFEVEYNSIFPAVNTKYILKSTVPVSKFNKSEIVKFDITESTGANLPYDKLNQMGNNTLQAGFLGWEGYLLIHAEITFKDLGFVFYSI